MIVAQRWWSVCAAVVLGTASVPSDGQAKAWDMEEAAAVKALLAGSRMGVERGVAVESRGVRGPCLVFDGIRGRVQASDFPSLDLSEQATVAAWVKINARNIGKRQAIASQARPAGEAWCLYVVSAESQGASGLNHQVGLDLQRGGKVYTHRTAGPTLTQGLWYHVAVTLEAGTLRVYVDGVKVLEKPKVGSLGAAGGPLVIGNDLQGSSPLAGALDGLTVRARALEEQEVAALVRDQMGSARREGLRQGFLAEFPRASQMTHWVLPGNPERPREGKARAAFLARFPDIPPTMEAARRPWTDYLEPPFWYSKAWTWREAEQWRARAAATVIVMAAADSAELDKARAQHVCRGSDDDVQIQAALDALPKGGGKVVLCKGSYLLGNCLMPKDDTELEIQGTLRVAPAIVSRLTADAPSKQNAVTVEDAGKLRVGQWVTLIDETKADHKNGWTNPAGGRKYGDCTTIERIEGHTIRLRGELCSSVWDEWATRGSRASKGYRSGYSVAAKAFLTTSHSAIVVCGRSRVYIHGSGEIDGCKAQQSRTAPLSAEPPWMEQVVANSGVVIKDSSLVTVEGLRIHDANLHNVTVYRSENCAVSGVEAWGCNDKNILLLSTIRIKVQNNYCHDSVCEDGVCLYFANHCALLAGNRTESNPRYNVWLNPSCRHETLLAREALGR